MRCDRRAKRLDLLTTLFTILFFVVILGTGLYLEVLNPQSDPRDLWYLVIIVIIMMLALVEWHAYNYSYICPKCQFRFRLSMFQDLISPQWTPEKKLIKCPNCKQKTWMRETIREK